LKSLFFILALTGIVFQNVSKSIILVNFELNKEYISKNLCEKKNIKGNCCQGSCQLKKQLKKADDHHNRQAPSTKGLEEIQLFGVLQPITLNVNLFVQQSIQFSLTTSIPLKPVFSIFHPPKS